ncbi:hypothetical protein AB836_02175 [Rickettsiales bacterium (ex Bugula neritina AB1)]|nr:hypothetical protein AB836_02175 [Rickettsiales bacterium (ex Bugula neritina AB1)]
MSNERCGFIGLPNVGKSKLFKLTTKSLKALEENRPFTTINPNIGTVNVIDDRVDKLSNINKSKKKHYSTIEVHDIAGLIQDAYSGAGLGNKFLGNILEVDVIIHVVRCFQDEEIAHVYESPNPERDLEIIETELFLWDLHRVEEMLKKKKYLDYTIEDLKKAEECLKNFQYPPKSKIPLITNKPMIILGNGNDEELVKKLQDITNKKNLDFIHFDFKDIDNQKNLNMLINTIYKKMNYISFFTSGPMETRSWTITKNTKAKEAAAKIHTDLMKKFICANVIKYEDYVNNPSKKSIMKKSDYIVEDGDIIVFSSGK